MPDGRCLVWYTNYSLIGQKSGFDMYSSFTRPAISASLGSYCNVFQSEISVILAQANLGLSKQYSDKRILIPLDSQATLKALDSIQIFLKFVREYFESLSTFACLNMIDLSWAQGHRGDEGNNHTDTLASEVYHYFSWDQNLLVVLTDQLPIVSFQNDTEKNTVLEEHRNILVQ